MPRISKPSESESRRGGGSTTCTEFWDLHDVPAQEARHKARLEHEKNVINWVFELSWRNSQNAPVVSYGALAASTLSLTGEAQKLWLGLWNTVISPSLF